MNERANGSIIRSSCVKIVYKLRYLHFFIKHTNTNIGFSTTASSLHIAGYSLASQKSHLVALSSEYCTSKQAVTSARQRKTLYGDTINQSSSILFGSRGKETNCLLYLCRIDSKNPHFDRKFDRFLERDALRFVKTSFLSIVLL